jgi:hypothetical protein
VQSLWLRRSLRPLLSQIRNKVRHGQADMLRRLTPQAFAGELRAEAAGRFLGLRRDSNAKFERSASYPQGHISTPKAAEGDAEALDIEPKLLTVNRKRV